MSQKILPQSYSQPSHHPLVTGIYHPTVRDHMIGAYSTERMGEGSLADLAEDQGEVPPGLSSHIYEIDEDAEEGESTTGVSSGTQPIRA